MKRIISILIITNAIIFSAQAQISKGKILITSGSDITLMLGNNKLEYDGHNLSEIKSESFSFKPSVGIFVADNLALGLSIPLEFTKIKDDTNTNEQTSFGVAPFLRWYLSKSNIKPYINLDAGYLSTKTTSATSNSQNVNGSFRGLILNGGVGVSAFISEKVAFDTQLSYGYGLMSFSDDSKLKLKTNAFGVLIGFTIVL